MENIKEIRNLANMFYILGMPKEGELLLNILDLTLKDGVLYYKRGTPNEKIIHKRDRKEIDIWKVTPLKLNALDVESIVSLINSDKIRDPKILAPMLSSIGWVLRKGVDSWEIFFVGSELYKVWNEPVVRWDEDLEEDCTDWKSGNDWEDGWDLEKDIPKTWLEP